MSFGIEIRNLSFGTFDKSKILKDLNINISPGEFVAVLGENGAGKTTLLDLLMGFRKPSDGHIKVQGTIPHEDNWELRRSVAYLSEKVDIPGDWSVSDFLEFNKYFYISYSNDLEIKLLKKFRIDKSLRLGNMSAGEIRRVQVAGALCIQPKLIIVDEITAVLDIVGRRRFMEILTDLNKNQGCTVILATNILEDLEKYASHILLVRNGKLRLFQAIDKFLVGHSQKDFSQRVADILEEE